ncbi:MAG TPA: translation initiation factor IF-2 N-terminal domain-containing protein, partial [Gemmatimonadales bacterium]|nr:translation initiation factor IF-2 N-terminal domain-containing protein [Gemmatimonadales bacterium]
MRVYEIAKEVGIPNKDLIAKIRALGLEVNNHMSSLDADDVARIKRSLEKERQSVAQPQQTQRLAPGGTVLRRRSSGERPGDGPVDDHSADREPMRRSEPERHAATSGTAPAPTAGPAPVIRRRVVAEEPPTAAPGASSSPARPVVRAPETPVT